MAKCDICSKDVLFGLKVSHSNRKTNRTWKPNIRRIKISRTVLRRQQMSAQGVCVQTKLQEQYNNLFNIKNI